MPKGDDTISSKSVGEGEVCMGDKITSDTFYSH